MSSKFVFLLFCGFLAALDVDANPVEKPLLRGVTLVAEPYVRQEGQAFQGFMVDLIEKISEKAGFNYQLFLSPDGAYGMVKEDGTINGMLGEVNQSRADFALADITITEKRKPFVDFTTPFRTVQLAMVLNKDHAKKMTTFEDMINYNTQLEDKSAQIPIGFLSSGSTNQILSTTTDTVGKSLYENAQRDQTNLVKSNSEGVQRAKDSKFGMIMTSDAAEYYVNHNCNLALLRDNRNLVTHEYAIALPKGSKWLEPFNKAIKELKDDGTIENLRKPHWKGTCSR